ncbi:MAG TPA: class I SAM-dependent methyltransferase [Flavitalea sp.]|nr:class I SAM-dependent methyltransferase [Flavitalea sp.]
MATKSEQFYDRLAVLYPVIDLFLKPQKHKFFSKINGCARGRLLEIGVGNGAHLPYYRTHDVVGIDTSARMLARARRHAQGNIQLLQMNGENLLFPDKAFDYVVLSHVITVVDNPDNLFEEVYRVLKPNGQILILNHFTPRNWLKYLDKLFERVSGILHFKSVFDISQLHAIKKFKLMEESDIGRFSYFKIMVYEKKL